jgi:hypothetical protein
VAERSTRVVLTSGRSAAWAVGGVQRFAVASGATGHDVPCAGAYRAECARGVAGVAHSAPIHADAPKVRDLSRDWGWGTATCAGKTTEGGIGTTGEVTIYLRLTAANRPVPTCTPGHGPSPDPTLFCVS